MSSHLDCPACGQRAGSGDTQKVFNEAGDITTKRKVRLRCSGCTREWDVTTHEWTTGTVLGSDESSEIEALEDQIEDAESEVAAAEDALLDADNHLEELRGRLRKLTQHRGAA